MRRFTSVILSILLGGFAVALGMGFFLMKANTDRERLANVATQAQQAAQAATAERDQAVTEANQKLDTANAEVAKAENAITSLQQERDEIAGAQVLGIPSAHATRNWKEAIDLETQTSFKFPPTSAVASNDGTGLVIVQSPSGNSTTSTDARWLTVTPFDASQESQLENSFVTSTAVSYLVDGHLLVGKLGTTEGAQNNVFVLRVQKDGVPSGLIWLNDPTNDTDNAIAMNVLASLSFPN
ncbi:MAG: hypothetical protein WA001_02515 [Patescibacteria group bacterium]